MDIEERKKQLEGAERDGWCDPGVSCEICQRAFLIDFVEIVKVRRPETTYYYYVCIECQAVKLGINNRGVG